jgi:hypothetical protein
MGHSRPCQAPQFGIHEWKQLFGCAFLLATNRLQDLRNRNRLSHPPFIDGDELKARTTGRTARTDELRESSHRLRENFGEPATLPSHYLANGHTFLRYLEPTDLEKRLFFEPSKFRGRPHEPFQADTPQFLHFGGVGPPVAQHGFG